MRRAIIDQIMLWMLIFVSFVSLLFLAINYYVVLEVNENSGLLATYGARMKALGREDDNITTNLNILAASHFNTINENNLTCTDLGTTNYRVVFTTDVKIKNRFVGDNQKIYSTYSAFNEVNDHDINCTLDLSITQ